jgi:hypothetical protein
MPVVELAAVARTRDGTFFHRVLTLGSALFPTRVILFLALFAWHVQVAVDPRCVFFVQNDLFLWNYRFLRDFLVVPGGLAEWMGGLVLQACHYGWPGAVVLTAIAWLICVATVGFFKCLSPTGAGIAWTFPAVVLLVLHSRYDHAFSVSIGAALAMLAAFGYARASAHWPRWRVVLFAGLCLLIYYVAGAAFYLFALCSMIHAFYAPGNGWMKLSLIVWVIVAKCAVDSILATSHPGLLYLHIPSAQPFREVLALSAATVALYVSFPLFALALADRTARGPRGNRTATGPPSPEASRPQSAGSSAGLRSLAVTLLFLVVAALASRLALRRDERTVLRLHDSADHQRWDDVLRLASHVPPDSYSECVRHDVNQALFHTGRMPYDMFLYPQSSEPFVLLTGTDPYALRRRRICEFHLQLGRVNDAEFHAHESLVGTHSAHSLRQLARIAIVKGQVEVARLFLNVLRDDLIDGPWADDGLRQLQEDPTFSSDTEVMQIRSLMVTDDDIHYATSPLTSDVLSVSDSDSGQLSSLVRRNPPNQMAFEYTMARFLVMRDLETVVQLLPRVSSLAYPAMPPLYEEAAMIFLRTRREQTEILGAGIVVKGCRISDQTLDKVRGLDASLGLGPADPAEISRAAGEVGLEYFRYYYDRGGGL